MVLKMDFSEAKRGYIHHWIQQEVPGAPQCQKPGGNSRGDGTHTGGHNQSKASQTSYGQSPEDQLPS